MGLSGSRQGPIQDLQLPLMGGSRTCSVLNSSSHDCSEGNSRNRVISQGNSLTRLRSGKLLSWTFGAMQRRQRVLAIL